MNFSVDTMEQARAETRRHATTFYFASHALPPEKRLSSYALYSFCRHVDNIADVAENAATACTQLEAVRSLLDEIYDSKQHSSRWATLRDTVRKYAIPKQYLLDLVDGVQMDLAGFHSATFDDLRKYCYHVASVVGLMMTRILQPDDENALPYAEQLGTAMQLTNILRDIGEDYGMHRVYLPADEMQGWGVNDEVLRKREVTPEFRRFMQFQISRAREFYAKAEPGIALLPNDGSRYCVQLMSVLYGRILNAIEANGYDVFTRRAHVSLPTKIRLTAAITLRSGARPYFPGFLPKGRIQSTYLYDEHAVNPLHVSHTMKDGQPHE